MRSRPGVKWSVGAVAALVVLLLSTASVGPGAPADGADGPLAIASGDAAAAATETTATTAAVPRGPRGSGEAITIAFVGDIAFEGELADRLVADPATAIGPFAEVLASADLAIGNLESALGAGGAPLDKEFTFRAPPEAVEALRAAGFDAISLANNHGMDYGPEGLASTLAIVDAQPDRFLIGAGYDETHALAPYTVTVRGQRISVIAATQVIDSELIASWTATAAKPGLASAKQPEALLAAVTAARAVSDTVVVYLHWGVELADCPTETQVGLARQLLDAGADIVVGGHAHRLQGAGRLGRGFVAYGLGNFAFYAGGPETAATGVLEVTVTGREIDGYRLIPGRISGRVPRPLEGDEAVAAVADWEALRPCTGLDA